MLEDIKLLNEKEDETQVTIQEAKLKKERDEAEARTSARNSLRKMTLSAGQLPHDGEGSDPKIKVDFVKDESLNVMADMIPLVKK